MYRNNFSQNKIDQSSCQGYSQQKQAHKMNKKIGKQLSQVQLMNRQMQGMSISEKQQLNYKKFVRPIIFQKNNLFKKQIGKVDKKPGSNQKNRQILQFSHKTEASNTENNIQVNKHYQRDIISVLQSKHISRTEDFPLNLKKYSQIDSCWRRKHKNSIIKRINFTSVQNLTSRAFGGLDHNQCLNDDIVNIYIQLLQRQTFKQNKIKIVNSYFATSTINKEYNRIDKFLKNRNIDKENRLIIPINQNFHWYFVYLSGTSLIIFDSLSKQSKEYENNVVIQNIYKFARRFYEVETTTKISRNFPKQNNAYDCGVFMLLGIKDMLKHHKSWLFKQQEIRFKRWQMAAQILDEKLFPEQFDC